MRLKRFFFMIYLHLPPNVEKLIFVCTFSVQYYIISTEVVLWQSQQKQIALTLD